MMIVRESGSCCSIRRHVCLLVSDSGPPAVGIFLPFSLGFGTSLLLRLDVLLRGIGVHRQCAWQEGLVAILIGETA